MKKLNFTFFFFWSIAFLLITIIGFIPTFLLRPIFRETSLPIYLIIHGVLMLFWFSGYFSQNLLIAKGDLVNHRKFGLYWFLLAILMAIGNLNVVLNISNEVVTGNPTYFGEIRTYENSGGFVIGNLFITIFSSILILIAYWKRLKPGAHKRAIFGASFLLVTPAFDRFIRPFGLPEIFQFLGSFIIPISLLVYEIIRYRKVHPMTLLVLAIMFLMIPVLMTIMNNEGYIQSIIEFLG
ncbi:hypothetical protein [Algoriphagus pacificus]|uniref:Uncharacterized protein n=1 Tax=Algoriphagus pacificus TaxID=2811234 RepID=A0ABS3CDL9_9BACT|nr:hypothetical protein [Algoriphagus pacificus]MBN7815163.1 hypothetical protein [Algoriphagus pacificus]